MAFWPEELQDVELCVHSSCHACPGRHIPVGQSEWLHCVPCGLLSVWFPLVFQFYVSVLVVPLASFVAFAGLGFACSWHQAVRDSDHGSCDTLVFVFMFQWHVSLHLCFAGWHIMCLVLLCMHHRAGILRSHLSFVSSWYVLQSQSTYMCNCSSWTGHASVWHGGVWEEMSLMLRVCAVKCTQFELLEFQLLLLNDMDVWTPMVGGWNVEQLQIWC